MNAPSAPSNSRLLVVDDDPAQREALLDTLSDEGYEVEVCASPAAALQRAAATPFDLVLTDLQMPEMDGIELTRLLQDAAPDVVVVLMSGKASVPSVVEAMRNGAIDCIQKPFRAATLLPVIERALEVQRLRASNRRLEAEVQRQFEQLVAVNSELGRVNTNSDRVVCAGQYPAWRSRPHNSPPLSTACPSSVATSA